MKKLWLAILVAVCLSSCKKELSPVNLPVDDTVSTSSNLQDNNLTSIIVGINQGQTNGFRIPSIFEGLSYETNILNRDPNFLNENNTVLVQLIKNLGGGILRIGGNQSDLTGWAGSSLTTEQQAGTPDSLTTADIDRLAAFSKAIGWPVIFGLNMGHYNVNAAASEAVYVHNALQNNLYALQSGNEPDVYFMKPGNQKYSYKDYQNQWDSYFMAIRKADPTARFAGPDVIPFDNNFVNSFADTEHDNVRMIDGHYYNCGPASNPAISYKDVLTQNPRLEGYLVDMNKIATKYHMPYRISECNSVFGGGKAGASDVFASALWALDFMWTVAENNGQGINFHGGNSHFFYTPITGDNGRFSARPEYYAMLAFHHASMAGRIIPAQIQNPRSTNNCSVYACAKPDSSYAITLINKEVSKNFSFTVQLTKTAATIQIARLKAPSITAADGITFNGSSVNVDGTYAPAMAKAYTVNQKSFVIKVPAGSAAVVTVR